MRPFETPMRITKSILGYECREKKSSTETTTRCESTEKSIFSPFAWIICRSMRPRVIFDNCLNRFFLVKVWRMCMCRETTEEENATAVLGLSDFLILARVEARVKK